MAQKDTTFELMRQWMEINQDLWNNWLNSTRHLGKGPSGLDDAYHEQIKGLRSLVDDTMRLERDWMKSARSQASQNQTLEPVVRFYTDMAEQALETRSRMWKTVFDSAQAVDLSAPANAMGSIQGPQEFIASIREFTERMMGSQAAGAKKTAEAAAPAEGAGSSESGKAGSGEQGKQAKAG